MERLTKILLGIGGGGSATIITTGAIMLNGNEEISSAKSFPGDISLAMVAQRASDDSKNYLKDNHLITLLKYFNQGNRYTIAEYLKEKLGVNVEFPEDEEEFTGKVIDTLNNLCKDQNKNISEGGKKYCKENMVSHN